MASKLQKLGKDEVNRRIKIKQKLRKKQNLKQYINKSLFRFSILINIFLLGYFHYIPKYYNYLIHLLKTYINSL